MPNPGIYLIRNVLNGKCYVGLSKNVRRRLVEHAGGRGCSPIIQKAILKYGTASFVAEPLYYSLMTTDGLLEAETYLIAAYNCIRAGYNVQAASKTYGPYGARFSVILKAAHTRPEVKAKVMAAVKVKESNPVFRRERRERLIKQWADPAYREKRIASFRKAMSAKWNDPMFVRKAMDHIHSLHTSEMIARRSAAQRVTKSTPAFKSAQSERSKKNMSNPELKKQIIEKMKATMATPEFKARRSVASTVMHTPEVRALKSDSMLRVWADPDKRKRFISGMRGFKWITDGKSNLHLRLGDPLPTDWHFGKTRKS